MVVSRTSFFRNIWVMEIGIWCKEVMKEIISVLRSLLKQSVTRLRKNRLLILMLLPGCEAEDRAPRTYYRSKIHPNGRVSRW